MANSRLAKIAKLMDKEEAFQKFIEAAAMEEAADFSGAIKIYKEAYKLWNALDSTLDDNGLPTAVCREAESAGIDCDEFPTELALKVESSPRFDIDSPDWLPYLKENGYCIISEAADSVAVARAKTLFWEFLESVPGTQVSRKDCATWEKGWVPNARNGIVGCHGFGQSDFLWHARTLPKVRQAYEHIWNCKDLMVSFDGGNAFRPWAQKPEWRTSGGWWHVDQNAFLDHQDGFRCVQGLVTFTDATAATGGLCVIPGSHNDHKGVCERAFAHIQSGHYVQVQPGDPVLIGAKLVCAKAGDLLLWDSRCVHCNTPGTLEEANESQDDKPSEHELLRVAAYVCMTPASWADSQVVEQRKQGFLNNETTNHVPHEYHGSDQALDWPARKAWNDASLLQKQLIVGKSDAIPEGT